MQVIKRDGRTVAFDKDKIINAIEKAILEIDKEITEDNHALANKIATTIENKNKDLTVEEIQNEVEKALMMSKRKDIAKKYILYRNERTRVRNLNTQMMRMVLDKTYAKKIDNSNANVDERSFGGRKKEASDIIQKKIAEEFLLSNEVKQGVEDGYIYEHDFSEFAVGMHNCLNIDFEHIFTHGFRTRNGDVRPPNSFSTACQLIAVAFQCQSQNQYGGVGSVHIDYDLAPFVKKSFVKHFKNGLKYCEKFSDYKIERCFKWYENISIDNINIKTEHEDAYNYAIDMLEKEGKQACQGLYHNLNTLESRAGSQVPFTSINLGRDTSTEGRLITKWLMDASINGIGRHHLTSIFPISIFQYKQGTNANPEDSNYDLKKLAIKSLSKRIYPNWVNGDWSQAHENPKDIDTYFSTMG